MQHEPSCDRLSDWPRPLNMPTNVYAYSDVGIFVRHTSLVSVGFLPVEI